MNNDEFTVLVSGGSRCHWVSMCTVWLSHSEWLSKENNESTPNFALSLNIPPQKLFGWLRRPSTMGNWWLAASSWQRAHSNTMSCAEFFSKTSNHPGDSAPLQPRFGALQLLPFPKTKITFEREEISDHQWDSVKYNRAADENWGKTVRCQGAYSEEDWGVIVLCTIFRVSSSMNVCLNFIVHG